MTRKYKPRKKKAIPEVLEQQTLREHIVGFLEQSRQLYDSNNKEIISIESDDYPKELWESQAIQKKLRELKSSLSEQQNNVLDLEDLLTLYDKTMPTPTPNGQPNTFEELIQCLNTTDKRKTENRLLSLVRTSTEKIKQEWMEQTEFADGAIDYILLNCDTIDKHNASE